MASPGTPLRRGLAQWLLINQTETATAHLAWCGHWPGLMTVNERLLCYNRWRVAPPSGMASAGCPTLRLISGRPGRAPLLRCSASLETASLEQPITVTDNTGWMVRARQAQTFLRFTAPYLTHSTIFEPLIAPPPAIDTSVRTADAACDDPSGRRISCVVATSLFGMTCMTPAHGRGAMRHCLAPGWIGILTPAHDKLDMHRIRAGFQRSTKDRPVRNTMNLACAIRRGSATSTATSPRTELVVAQRIGYAGRAAVSPRQAV
jgi:hypothetical protein